MRARAARRGAGFDGAAGAGFFGALVNGGGTNQQTTSLVTFPPRAFGNFVGICLLFVYLIAGGIVVVITPGRLALLSHRFFVARRRRLIFIETGILLIAHCDQSSP